MAEYIEKSIAIAIVSDCVELCPIEKSESIGRIEASTAADVAPVVHGRWIDEGTRDEDGNGQYTCSNCDHHDNHSPGIDVPFCWHCGARMDGVNIKQENKHCPHCMDAETLGSDAGQHDFRIMGNGLFYFDSQLGWEGVTINFCPWCGRDLTKEE